MLKKLSFQLMRSSLRALGALPCLKAFVLGGLLIGSWTPLSAQATQIYLFDRQSDHFDPEAIIGYDDSLGKYNSASRLVHLAQGIVKDLFSTSRFQVDKVLNLFNAKGSLSAFEIDTRDRYGDGGEFPWFSDVPSPDRLIDVLFVAQRNYLFASVNLPEMYCQAQQGSNPDQINWDIFQDARLAVVNKFINSSKEFGKSHDNCDQLYQDFFAYGNFFYDGYAIDGSDPTGKSLVELAYRIEFDKQYNMFAHIAIAIYNHSTYRQLVKQNQLSAAADALDKYVQQVEYVHF